MRKAVTGRAHTERQLKGKNKAQGSVLCCIHEQLWLLPCAGGMAFLSVFKAFILRLQAGGARTCPLPNAPTCDVSFTARLLSLGAAFKSPRHWHCESLPAGAFHKARRPRSSVFQTPLGPCSPGRPLALAWCSSCQRHYPTTPQIGIRTLRHTVVQDRVQCCFINLS